MERMDGVENMDESSNFTKVETMNLIFMKMEV